MQLIKWPISQLVLAHSLRMLQMLIALLLQRTAINSVRYMICMTVIQKTLMRQMHGAVICMVFCMDWIFHLTDVTP